MKILYMAAIRVTAQKLVGQCTDWQIMEVVQRAGIFGPFWMVPGDLLDDMEEADLRKLSEWIIK
jgi:hypothetical protein